MTSLGITRSFPRLYPVMGLVTVALLTLAPLALRPVRLACLIHAANVHSEPGSNPSKVVETPGPRRPAATLLNSGLRNTDWSHRSDRSRGHSPPRHAAAGFERPPSPSGPKTMRSRRRRRPVAGSPQGFTIQHDPRSTELSKSARAAIDAPDDVIGRSDSGRHCGRRHDPAVTSSRTRRRSHERQEVMTHPSHSASASTP